MQIKRLGIHHYRQFMDESVCLEDEITYLAGANNSGKTSIVELLSVLFGETSKKLSVEDMPVEVYSDLVLELSSEVKTIFGKEKDEKKVLDEISNLFTNSRDDKTELLKRIKEKCINIQIEIGYKENESIERFAPYLMDLDEETYGFYFEVAYDFNQNAFIRAVKDKFSCFLRCFKTDKKASTESTTEKREETFNNLISDALRNSFNEIYCYGDKNYQNLQLLEEKQFTALFYFGHISANRDIPDEKKDKRTTISNAMMDFLGNEQWEQILDTIPEEILQIIQNYELEKIIKENSLDKLSEVITNINETNGGSKEKLIASSEVSDEALKSFLTDITKAKYEIDNFYFSESSQGLGYTNMIYMHLQYEKYVKGIDETGLPRVNFFVVEEPEAHMHPQMQKVFIQHLMKNYTGKKLQGIVTTHSSEIVRLCNLETLRVVRPNDENKFTKRICDIRKFLECIEEKAERKNLYNLLYSINFADIIFADKIIMFEGDTERMYIKKLLELEKYDKLAKQYIALVQVGGAYAHWYKEIIFYLKIKTLILTDIDYEKDKIIINEIEDSTNTNGAIKSFYRDTQVFIKSEGESAADNKLKIKELYDWKNKCGNKLPKGIMVNFQGPNDGYTRTLEEAMLSKKFDITIETKLTRKEWKNCKDQSKLLFVIPRSDKKKQMTEEEEEEIEKEELSLRQIVKATSDKKTDFMYSVILNSYVENMLPNYIEEGLEWLMN